MIMKFRVNQAVFTEKQKGNQFFTMDIYICTYIYTHIYVHIYMSTVITLKTIHKIITSVGVKNRKQILKRLQHV